MGTKGKVISDRCREWSVVSGRGISTRNLKLPRMGPDWFGHIDDEDGRGPRGCEVATGCEVACKHWLKMVWSGCEVGVMYGPWPKDEG